MVKEIKTKDEFDELVKSTSKLIVIDFFATWCGPCKMIAPKLEEWEKTYEADVVFVKVDVDDNGETAEACGISAMPTIKFYKGGAEVSEVVGANTGKIEDEIKAKK